jgi:hypothetical protein
MTVTEICILTWAILGMTAVAILLSQPQRGGMSAEEEIAINKIKSAAEPHERVTKENQLDRVA